MRIGIDCRLWNETGVGRYTRNLVTELAKIDKKNSYILFFRNEEFNTVTLPGKNFEKHKASMRWHTIKEQVYLPFLLQKFKLDLVHFPYFSVPTQYRGKFIVTIHDLILDHFDTGEASTLPWIVYKAKRLAYKYIISQTAAKAARIIAVSEATKQEIVDHLPISKDKISVVYEGVDTNVHAGVSEKPLVKSPYYLYVGNAYPHKNLVRLLEAYGLFLQKVGVEIPLIFVGKEDYFYKQLQVTAQSMFVDQTIQFLRNVDDKQLASLYKNANALVVPSLMEGFGLPILEAMVNDCNVLASDIPAFREIGKDAIMYFNPESPESIAKALEKNLALDKTTREKYSKAGIARSKLFSFEKMAKETLALYHAVTSNNDQSKH